MIYSAGASAPKINPTPPRIVAIVDVNVTSDTFPVVIAKYNPTIPPAIIAIPADVVFQFFILLVFID